MAVALPDTYRTLTLQVTGSLPSLFNVLTVVVACTQGHLSGLGKICPLFSEEKDSVLPPEENTSPISIQKKNINEERKVVGRRKAHYPLRRRAAHCRRIDRQTINKSGILCSLPASMREEKKSWLGEVMCGGLLCL